MKNKSRLLSVVVIISSFFTLMSPVAHANPFPIPENRPIPDNIPIPENRPIPDNIPIPDNRPIPDLKPTPDSKDNPELEVDANSQNEDQTDLNSIKGKLRNAASWFKNKAFSGWRWIKDFSIELGISIKVAAFEKVTATRDWFSQIIDSLKKKYNEKQLAAEKIKNREVRKEMTERPHGTIADVKHVTDEELVGAARLVYELSETERREYLKRLGDSWREDELLRRDESNGFQGKVFVNNDGENPTVIISYRGTEFFKRGLEETVRDVWADAQLTVGIDEPSQLRSAQALYEEAKRRYPNHQIIITGHSLGGWLASKVGVNNKVPTFTFNAPGIKNNLSQVQKEANEKGAYDDLVYNYIDPRDLIGTFGTHAGKTYYMYEDRTIEVDEKDSRFDDDSIVTKIKQLKHKMDAHGVEVFLDDFKEVDDPNKKRNFEGVVR